MRSMHTPTAAVCPGSVGLFTTELTKSGVCCAAHSLCVGCGMQRNPAPIFKRIPADSGLVQDEELTDSWRRTEV
eukprot:680872-Rhodomonas_salina.2